MKNILFVSILSIFAMFLFSGCSNTPSAAGGDGVKINNGDITVYFKKPDGWPESIYLYYYKNSIVQAYKWPGILMKKEENNWYSFKITEDWYKESKVIFYGNNGNRDPQDMQPGYEVYTIGKGSPKIWYSNKKFYTENPDLTEKSK